MAAYTPIPDKPHPRAVRWDDWLVRRISARRVRVTSPLGYVTVAMGPGSFVSDATDLAAHEVEQGRAEWTPVPSRRGASKTPAERQASGLTRLSPVWLSREAEAARARLAEQLGSTRAALEWALTQAPTPLQRSVE